MSRALIAKSLIAVALLSGCATEPMGPTTLVMPAQGKPFEVFAQDQTTCKQFADHEVGGNELTANLKEFGTAAISTALGAGLGAALRGARGAGIGGALGAVAGTAMAGRGSSKDQAGLQGRYNIAYTQCMYSRGNQVAGMGRAAPGLAQATGYPQSAGAMARPGQMPGAATYTYGNGVIH